jgi:hypothetical protein
VPFIPISPYPDRPDKPIAPTLDRWFTALRAAVNQLLTGTQTGEGDPEGVVTAPQGTLYRRTDGGAGTTLYVKTSGGVDTPTAVGWTAK